MQQEYMPNTQPYNRKDKADLRKNNCLASAACGAAVAGVAATCIKSGACSTGSTGSQVHALLQAAASERRTMAGRPAFGFTGDPSSTINGKYAGNMVWAKF